MITVLPMEKSFFFQTTFSKKIKLTDDLVRLNYNRYSPIKNQMNIYRLEEERLYLWFYAEEIKTPFIIPESYLLFTLLKKEHNNKLIIVTAKEIYKILVIKNNLLEAVFTLASLDSEIISITLHEHLLDEVVTLSEQEYNQLYSNGIKELPLFDILKWNVFKINRDEILNKSLNFIAYPLSFLIVFIMLIGIYHTNKLEIKIESLKEKYLEVKNLNQDVKNKIAIKNQEKEKWMEFINRELVYPDSAWVIDKLYKITQLFDNVELQNIKIGGSKIQIQIKIKEKKYYVSYLNELNSIKEFSNVFIKHVNQKSHVVSYSIDLLPLGGTDEL